MDAKLEDAWKLFDKWAGRDKEGYIKDDHYKRKPKKKKRVIPPELLKKDIEFSTILEK